MNAFSADIVFPIHIPPIKNGIVIVDEKGIIADLLDPAKDEIPADLQVKRLDGIICPGFVNAHCHLELSHLKGKFLQHKGLPHFIGEMIEKREDGTSHAEAIAGADAEMFEAGISAVGDISNGNTSIDTKTSSKIYYHTFVELFDVAPGRAEIVFENGKKLREEFAKSGLTSSLVPHSPYTVTDALMKLIFQDANANGNPVCIHNQETESEDEMFKEGKGNLLGKLRQINDSFGDWTPVKKSSLSHVLELLPGNLRLMLVHNTFSRATEVRYANQSHPGLVWCLCVNANLFIENKVPDIEMLHREDCLFTIGTDSYASNISLSILDELKTILRHFPGLAIDQILRWATLNGAGILGIEDRFGSIEKGKSPGLINITSDDASRLILDSSRVKRLI